MNQRTLAIVCGAAILIMSLNAARTEYARIQASVSKTQAKVDALADELASTTKTIHAAIRSITDRFVKQSSIETIEHPQSETIEVFAPPINPTIVMHSGYSCGPCNAWIATEKAKWESAGWTIEVVKEVSSTRGWPWFEITDKDGKRFQVDGPLTNDNFQSAKKATR